MPFDDDLVLQDGSSDYAITENKSPTSLTAHEGSVCLDIRGTRKRGLVAHLMVGSDLPDTNDTMQVTIEHCATVDGTYEEIARFSLLTYGDESAPCHQQMLFATPFDFIRAKIVIHDDAGADFSLSDVWVLIGLVIY